MDCSIWVQPRLFGEVWPLSGFEEHDVWLVGGDLVGHVLLEDLLIEWGQLGLVKSPRELQGGVAPDVGGSWLVERVVADDEFVLRESLGDCVPEGDEFVLDSHIILIESMEQGHGLGGAVVGGEVDLLALFDQRVAVLVFLIVVLLE